MAGADLHRRTAHPARSTPDAELRWRCLPFDEVPAATLYRVLALRSRVFVVEQRCFYEDLDGADLDALLVIGSTGSTGDAQVVATARVLPPEAPLDEPAIGRVCVSPEGRGRGWGRQLMSYAIDRARERYPQRPIRISAQAHLQSFYQSLGFRTRSDVYLEDGIPHIGMRLPAASAE
jgi:ElaA protein